ncbi:MAG: hypothetical protein U0174_15420 [Polyangiaceae bacterium]
MRAASTRIVTFIVVVSGLATIFACRGKVRVPKEHRATGETCPGTRGTPPEPSKPGDKVYAGDKCTKHADCTAGRNGRCFQGRKGNDCSYDECTSDADCKGGKGACKCRENASLSAANVCHTGGNCRVDADCDGNYCSPSLGSCGHYGGYAGFFCHSRKDECIDDSDCKKGDRPGSCRYVEEVGHFKCDSSECAG